MNEEKLSGYAPELYYALDNLLIEIATANVNISNDDGLSVRVGEANSLIQKIRREEGLKRCPFCGGKAKTVSVYWVKCSECNVEQSEPYETEAEAIAAWNRRAE